MRTIITPTWGGIIGALVAVVVGWTPLAGAAAEGPLPIPPPRTVIHLAESGVVADGKTDQHDRLQPLFDRANTGAPLEIINDLAGTLVTSGNDIWPNTMVRTIPGGTWLLAPGSRRGILRNRHPLASWPVGARRQDGATSSGPTYPDDAHAVEEAGRGDFNITLIGGTYDGNRRSGGWPNDGRTPRTDDPVLGRDDLLVSALQFYGVKHLVLQGVKVFDSPSLGVHVGNVVDLVAEDCEIACPTVIYGSNQDGFHINGPAQDIRVANLRIRQSGDDAIALNADDAMEATTEGNQALYFGMNSGWGPITQVRMKGVHLERCSSGIRPLSATQRITDVVLSDVDGTCLGACILFDKYLFNHDPGNIGTFTMDGVHLATLGLAYDGSAPGFTAPSAPPAEVFYCNTRVEDLELTQVSFASTGGSRWCHLHPCTITMLGIERAVITDSSAGGPGIALITVDGGAALTDVRIDGLDWRSTKQQAAGVIENQGAIAHLSARHISIPPQVRLVAGVQPVTQVVVASP